MSAQDDAASASVLRVLRGNPSEEELAAVTAVLGALASERTELGAEAVVPSSSAWRRSQRQTRTPLVPGPGRWRSFGG